MQIVMASTRFAGLVFVIMIIAVFLSREDYGASVANIAGRKALRDGKTEVFQKEESDGMQRSEEKPDKTSQEIHVDQASALEGSLNAMHDYAQEPPHGRRKPPINNNDPGN